MNPPSHTPGNTPRTDAYARAMTAAKVPATRCWKHWHDFASKLEVEHAALLSALEAHVECEALGEAYAAHMSKFTRVQPHELGEIARLNKESKPLYDAYMQAVEKFKAMKTTALAAAKAQG